MKEGHVEPPNSMQLSEPAVFAEESQEFCEDSTCGLSRGGDVPQGMVSAAAGASTPVMSGSWPR